MTGPDSPTEAFRRATRPLEVPVWLEGLRWVPETPPAAFCARCGGTVEPLSQGHYGSTCLATATTERHHFCCPRPAGCELGAA